MERILVVDDDKTLCEVLKRMLESRGYEAETVCSGASALEKLAGSAYQLIILDVMMPGMDGFETLVHIRADYNTPVLMLTAKTDSGSKVSGLQTGADDYLTKPFAMEELFARASALIRRYTSLNYGPQSRRVFAGMMIDADRKIVTRDNREVPLLAKEYEILTYCAENSGRVLTKKQIYEAVWQAPYDYNDNALMATISRLRKKIEPDPENPFYLQTVKGLGYRFTANH